MMDFEETERELFDFGKDIEQEPGFYEEYGAWINMQYVVAFVCLFVCLFIYLFILPCSLTRLCSSL